MQMWMAPKSCTEKYCRRKEQTIMKIVQNPRSFFSTVCVCVSFIAAFDGTFFRDPVRINNCRRTCWSICAQRSCVNTLVLAECRLTRWNWEWNEIIIHFSVSINNLCCFHWRIFFAFKFFVCCTAKTHATINVEGAHEHQNEIKVNWNTHTLWSRPQTVFIIYLKKVRGQEKNNAKYWSYRKVK